VVRQATMTGCWTLLLQGLFDDMTHLKYKKKLNL